MIKNFISFTHFEANTSTQLKINSLSGLFKWKIYLEGLNTWHSLLKCILPLNLLFLGSKYSKVPLEYKINYHVLYIKTYFIFLTNPLRIIDFFIKSYLLNFISSSDDESIDLIIFIGLFYFSKFSKSISLKNGCFFKSSIVLPLFGLPFPNLSYGNGHNNYDIKSLAYSSIPSSI